MYSHTYRDLVTNLLVVKSNITEKGVQLFIYLFFSKSIVCFGIWRWGFLQNHIIWRSKALSNKPIIFFNFYLITYLYHLILVLAYDGNEE